MARYNSVNSTGSIAGGLTLSTPASGLLTTITSSGNTTVPNPVLYAGSTQVFYNASGSTVALISPSGNFVGPSATNSSTISLVNGNVITITSDGTNYIVTDFQGGPLSGTALTATGAVTLNPANAGVSIQPTGSGGTLTIAPGTTAGNIDNMNIGATTKGTGGFTSLTATGAVTLTSTGAASAYNTSGASLLVSGGVGIAGALYTNSTASFAGNVTITNSGTLAVPGVTTISNNTAVTLGTAASGALQVTGGVGVGGSIYSSGAARHDGTVTFGAGNAYLSSSAGDNFTLSTKTNTPNPNFNINIGDGSGGISKNPIFWNGFLAFSGNARADTGSPDMKIDASGNIYMYTTGVLQIPVGTTAQRPSGNTAGWFRYNSTTAVIEFNNGSSWVGVGLKDGSSASNAAPSAAAIKAVIGAGVQSGVYWLLCPNVNSSSAFQCYCDFTMDSGRGYAIVWNNYQGNVNGPANSVFSSTSLTGTAGRFNNYTIAPSTMYANYNNGTGITRLITYCASNDGTSSGGITSASTYRWAVFYGGTSSVTNWQNIWTNYYTSNQFNASYLTGPGGVSGTAYWPNSHGNQVTQVPSGSASNSNNYVIFEYNGNGSSDPNHSFSVYNGSNGDSYYNGTTLYTSGALSTKWAGVAIF